MRRIIFLEVAMETVLNVIRMSNAGLKTLLQKIACSLFEHPKDLRKCIRLHKL